MTALVTFKAAEFLNGGVAPGDYLGSASLSIRDGRGDLGWSVRFALKNGADWYLSDANFAASETVAPVALDYTSGGLWAAFTPSTADSAALMTGAGLTYNVNGDTLDDIQEVGFFFEGIASGTTRTRVDLSGFTAEAIPEPGTFVLLSSAGAALLTARRRLRS
jgi:hypothetical protein